MSRLRDAVRADRAGLAARHPAAFAPAPARRVLAVAAIASLAALALFAAWRLEFSLARFGSGIVQLGHFVSLMVPPSSGGRLPTYVKALGETLAIAFLGTLLAALLALPLGFLAARNVVTNRIVHVACRRVLDTIRGIDVLIWALVFINVVGLGPFAGILAIAASDTGAFGKLFSEAYEAADPGPVEAVMACGGSRLEAIRFGLLPQTSPVIISQVLYLFESNTRSATIIGIVGAGGIGLHLVEQIRVLEWPTVAFLVLMILVTVAVIDWLSTRLRLAIIGRGRVAA
ncbi:MAG: phosphonate ABC transporter, permease protein PhnE [Xanthobacteraceae bacterium]|jgi:phosphonate transport system permease protein